MAQAPKPHLWYATGMKGIPWAVCGLIRLNNERTKRKARQACPGSEEDK